MSKVNAIFEYKDIKTIIECDISDMMIDICEKYGIKTQKEINKFFFIYNGNLINMNLKYKEQKNGKDKILENMDIIVEDKIEIEDNIKTKKENNIYKDGNYIISEVIIDKNLLNKEIRILNSYEEFKRKTKWFKGFEGENNYKNEKEIKKCKIKINNELIKFDYFHIFKEEGKYKIEYIFNEKINKMNFMFIDCSSLTKIDLSNFNAQNVTNMHGIFVGCKYLTNIDFSNFNTKKVTNMGYLFSGCNSLINIDLSSFNTQNVINMFCMFNECNSLKNLNLSNFNTKNVTNMYRMFNGCNSLKNIDLSSFNTQTVTNMSYMFSSCNSLMNLDLSSFNTKNVTNMNNMFFGCNSLTNIDLSNFNTSNVTNMSYMFYGCNSLTNIDISSFNTYNVKNMSYMFYGCNSLININLSNFTITNVYCMNYMFAECHSLIKKLKIKKCYIYIYLSIQREKY